MPLEETIPPCPACGAPNAIRGHFNDGSPGTFSVAGVSLLANGMVPLIDRSTPGAAKMSATAHACPRCGLVWTHVDLDRLQVAVGKRKEPRG